MGDLLRQNYGEMPLHYEKFFNECTEDCYEDPSKYVPRIEGTELECGITFGSLNYFPILTSRVVENKRKYYLFDFIKVRSEVEKVV